MTTNTDTTRPWNLEEIEERVEQAGPATLRANARILLNLARDQRDALRRKTEYIQELTDLDDTCHRGHTSQRALWDCPVCVNNMRAELAHLRADNDRWRALGKVIDHNTLHEEHHWYDDLAALLSTGEDGEKSTKEDDLGSRFDGWPEWKREIVREFLGNRPSCQLGEGE